MPEAVRAWADQHAVPAVRRVHGDLVQVFAEDIQKYAAPRGVRAVEEVFSAIPAFAGLRFKYERLAEGLGSRAARDALDLLEGARVVRRAWPTTSVAPPLRVRARAAPKLVPLDLGVWATQLGVPADELLTGAPERVRDGRAAEILVGRELLAALPAWDERLFFWTAGGPAEAEVDWLPVVGGRAVPVEVKAGASGTLRSLHQFLWRSGTRLGVRVSAGPLALRRGSVAIPQGEVDVEQLDLPLYAVPWLPHALSG